MNTKELIAEIDENNCILVDGSHDPILRIEKSIDPAFVINRTTGDMRYDIISEKIHFISCTHEDWVKQFLKNNPKGSFEDLCETFGSNTGDFNKKHRDERYQREKGVFLDAYKKWNRKEITAYKFDIIDPSKTYTMCDEAVRILRELDPSGELEVYCNEEPITYPEIKPTYWDGYGRFIKGGKFMYGDFDGLQWKACLYSTNVVSWLSSITSHFGYMTWKEASKHFDFSDMEEHRRKKTLNYLEEIFGECVKYWVDDFEQRKKWKEEGRETMVINIGFGTMVVPVPLGNCKDCAHFSDDACDLEEEEKAECTSVLGGFKYFTRRT